MSGDAAAPSAAAHRRDARASFKGRSQSRDHRADPQRDRANRIDLYLQPIVTLPQRKVRYYEAMSRLRTEEGESCWPADFLAHAEAAGLMPKIDNLVVFRCVQVVRRLLLKNRDIGLFCNMSGRR